MLASLLPDLRYAVRGLAARPLFVLVAVASLALGIGVNTAIYSLFHQVVLRPLPVASPANLFNISAPGPKFGNTSNNSAGSRDDILSHPMLRDLQRLRPDPVAGIAGHRSFQATLGREGRNAFGLGMMVSGNYFDLLGLVPGQGRLIVAADDATPGEGRVAVLSHRHWRDAWGGRADAVGSVLKVNGEALTVVGVAPPGFEGTTPGFRADVFVPLSLAGRLQPQMASDFEDRRSYWIYAFGRLAPGATREDAEAALNLPYARLIEDVEVPLHADLDAQRMAEFRAKRLLLGEGARGQSRTAQQAARPLGLLSAVAALVLLIACLNIANLLLARGAGRAGEFALRASIGASRGRLVRQLLLESALLAALGGLASLPLAALIAGGLVAWMPAGTLDGFEVGIDGAALRFAALVSLATVLLFGLFPALQLGRAEPIAALRGESGQSSSRGGNRFRASLATTQVALSMASLALAGLFAKSLVNLASEDLGMQVERMVVFSLSAERQGYDTEQARALFERIETRLAAVPGVTAVASSRVPLLSHHEWGSNVSVEGFESTPETLAPNYSMVGAGFFASMGIPLLAGRDIALADGADAPRVAVVNRRFAEYFGLGANPIGKRMAIGGSDDLDIEIVGLVADSKYADIKAGAYPLFFTPWRQREVGEMSFYLRAAVSPESLLPVLPGVVAEIDPDLPLENLRTVDQQIQRLIATERFVGLLSGAFAVLSTLLAALGLYGVLSYTLSQRMREIGLRLALGAAPRRLRAMVLGQVGRMTLVGGLLGLAAALALGRAAQSLLFGLDGHDPVVLAAACVLLGLVALGAAWLPARRVGRVDPMVALRHD